MKAGMGGCIPNWCESEPKGAGAETHQRDLTKPSNVTRAIRPLENVVLIGENARPSEEELVPGRAYAGAQDGKTPTRSSIRSTDPFPGVQQNPRGAKTLDERGSGDILSGSTARQGGSGRQMSGDKNLT